MNYAIEIRDEVLRETRTATGCLDEVRVWLHETYGVNWDGEAMDEVIDDHHVTVTAKAPMVWGIAAGHGRAYSR